MPRDIPSSMETATNGAVSERLGPKLKQFVILKAAIWLPFTAKRKTSSSRVSILRNPLMLQINYCLGLVTEFQNLTECHPKDQAWIGYTKEGKPSYVWSDASKNGYENWGKSEPNNVKGKEFCGTVGTTPECFNGKGKWNDTPCTNTLQFICKKRGLPELTHLDLRTIKIVKDFKELGNLFGK